MKWQRGDVFLVPIDDQRVGLGQIVDVLPSELYVVLFEQVWNASNPPLANHVLDVDPLLASLTLDAKLYHGDWKIIGNIRGNLKNIRTPTSKVRISGVMHVESHDGRWRRPATAEESDRLRFRKTVAPIRLQKALQAYRGVLPGDASYDELRYDLIVDLAQGPE